MTDLFRRGSFGILIITCMLYAENVVKNGDFEDSVMGWEKWGAQSSSEAHTGKGAAMVKADSPSWKGMHQIIILPDSIKYVKVSGWMKTSEVKPGLKSWENARISVDFVDNNEKVVGGFLPAIAEAVGTTDWTFYSKKLRVHEGSYALKLQIALGNAVGLALWDDIVVEFIAGDILSALKKMQKGGNQILNPGFEEGFDAWNPYGAKVVPSGKTGNYGCQIHNEVPKWSGNEQTLVIPENVEKVVISGWIKSENVVQGKESYEVARIAVEFLDKSLKPAGDHLPAAGELKLTNDWTFCEKSYTPPSNAKLIKVICMLGNAKGKAWFDDISCVFRGKGDVELAAGSCSGPADQGEWYEMAPGKPGCNYVDWSSLLHKPAGKHGFLTVKNGHFVFEDGIPVRFWGTNLVAQSCFADSAIINATVSRLAKMGCNLLRLHHMDAPWSTPNIFGNKSSTRKLDSVSLARLDYLIYKCKEAGIYIFLDILVHRGFTPEDGIEHTPPDNGAKQVGFFSRKLIDLQKEFATQLLTHINQYTGKAYKDEPAIVASEFINESTIFVHFGGDILTPPYRAELEKLWKLSKYKDKKLVKFGLDWADNTAKLSAASGGEIKESIMFLSQMEQDYYKEMEKHFRTIGVHYPLSGSNMPLHLLAPVRNNSIMDFVINNDYWDHPQVWKVNNDWGKTLYAPFNNTSQLKSLGENIIPRKAYFKVADKPFIITEWNHCYPNEYLLEGVPLIAAYGQLQGWDGLCQFDFDHNILGRDRIRDFTLSVSPEHTALWVISAPVFIRGDIKEAPGVVIEPVTEDKYNSLPNYSTFLDEHYYLPFATRVAKRFNGKGKAKPEDFKKYFNEEKGIIKSETGELSIDGKQGIFSVNAPRVQGVCGFISGKKFDFPLFSVKVKNTHAAIFAVSCNSSPLIESKHFYLVAVGPCKMSEQKFFPFRGKLVDAGKLPVMAQVIKGNVSFNTKAAIKDLTVIPLGIDGKKGKPLTLKKEKDALVLELGGIKTHVLEVTYSK